MQAEDSWGLLGIDPCEWWMLHLHWGSHLAAASGPLSSTFFSFIEQNNFQILRNTLISSTLPNGSRSCTWTPKILRLL